MLEEDGAIDQSVPVSESPEDKRDRQFQRRWESLHASETRVDSGRNRAVSRGQEVAAETEEPQEASLNIENANQSRSLQREAKVSAKIDD